MGERGDHPVDLGRETSDGLIEVVQLGQNFTDDQGVVAGKAALERLAQGRYLRPQPAFDQFRQDPGIAAAFDQGGEYGASRGAQDVRGHGGELDRGVLKDFIQPLGLPAPFFNLCLVIAGEVAQFPDLRRRHERGPHQAMGYQLGNPAASAMSVLRPGTLRRCRALSIQQAISSSRM